ncbi:MAG: DUF5047 domain-containing protein [Actinomycetes bacterium]
MIAASSKFQETLHYSHTGLTRIVADGVEVGIASGSLNLDAKAKVRRTASLRLVEDPLVPGQLSGIDAATELVVQKGIRFLDRTVEYVTVGTLYVQETSRDHVGRWVDVSASDAGQRVDDYPLTTSYAPAGVTVVNAIKALIVEAVGSSPTWVVDPTLALSQLTVDGQVFKAGTGRWSAVNDLASALGAVVFPDALGRWVIRSLTPTVAPVSEVSSGGGGVLVKAALKASRRDTFNAVTVEWGTPDVAGGVVTVTDDDPSSPTYWLGPWGKKPRPAEKLDVTTESAAVAAATARLAEYKGAQAGISFEAVYNPLLEPDDAVGVTLPGRAREVHVLDRISLPLVGGVMSADTRIVSAS